MRLLSLPWLELAVLLPLLGIPLLAWIRNPNLARKVFLVFSGLSLACVLGGWWNYKTLKSQIPTETVVWGLEMDELNAPLLFLTALLFVLTAFSKSRANVRDFSFAWTLVSQSLMLATLGSTLPWGIIVFLSLGTIPPLMELLQRKKRIGVFVTHMGTFIVLLVLGWLSVQCSVLSVQGNPKDPFLNTEHWTLNTGWVFLPLVIALFIRSGIAPFHCWMTDLFEHTSFGTAMLFVTPMPAAYAALRLLFPIAPSGLLILVGFLALATALYAAGMGLVQDEVRRFYCYLFLSFSALVLVGMDTSQPIGLTGSLLVWLSVALAMSGLGQTLRALESRHGRLSLNTFHGLYEHKPVMAAGFLLTGLAAVGFPGTFGFLGTEMLQDGAVLAYPYVGVIVVLVAALNGIAVLKVYFTLFGGTRHVSVVPLGIGARERVAVVTLAVLIFLGGLFPQFVVESRYQAAALLLEQRKHSVQFSIFSGKSNQMLTEH